MTLVHVGGAKLSFGSKILFEDITFSINDRDKVALVGNNGCGKSSLIKALLGEHELDKGEIHKKRGLIIGYVPQEIPNHIELKNCYDYLLDVLPPEAREDNSWRVDITLVELGLRQDLWHEKIQKLSGGWRRLLLIAAATLAEPDLLILDEPTNHLDLGKIFKLEKWLNDTIKIPYLVISHDRDFLDKCTNRTLFMRGDGMHEFSAAFSIARENLLQHDALAAKLHARQDVEIKRLEKSAKRLKEWGARSPQSDLSKKGEAIQTRANHLKEKQVEVYTEKNRDISLHYGEVQSASVLTVIDKTICTPDGRDLFKIERLSIKQGERVCILGRNGTGKSVFIRQLIDLFRARDEHGYCSESRFKFSPQLRLGYLDQHLDNLPAMASMYDYLVNTYALSHTHTTRELVAIGFSHDRHEVKIGKLSAGEKARLALLDLKLSKPNFYVLDEPTNHLDIQGQEDLEEELDDQGHTCVFVSHDRKMVRGAATRYLEIKGGRLVAVDSPEGFFQMLQREEENK